MHWKKQIEKMLKNDRVMGVSVKIFVKNRDFRKKIFDTLSFSKRLDVDLRILKAGIVFSKISC
jgi:hypothetical protein